MGVWPQGAWAIVFAALLGCQPPPGAFEEQPQPCPQAVFDQEIPVAATNAMLPVGVRAGPHTTDGAGGVAIHLEDNQGTVDFDGSGPMQAFIYYRNPWPEIGYTLLGGLAVTDGAWMPFWLYCAPDGSLAYVYAHRTDRRVPLRQFVSGTCNEVSEVWYMPLDLPAHTLRNVVMTCGFEVDTPPSDPSLRLESSKPGLVTIDGQPATALVFATVDCRACGSDPWFELHSLLWQPSTGQVGVGIWYLFGETSGTDVSARGVVTLPTGTYRQLPFPTATWTLGK